MQRTRRTAIGVALALMAAAVMGSPNRWGGFPARHGLEDRAADSVDDGILRSRDGRFSLEGRIVSVEDTMIEGGRISMEGDVAHVEIESLSALGFEMTAEVGDEFDAVFIVDDLLAPFAEGGLIECEGDLLLDDAATLMIIVAGDVAADDYDCIIVHGVAELGGTLVISLREAFEPRIGDEFIILIADAIVGEFSETIFPHFDDGRAMRLDMRQSEVAILIDSAH